MSTHSAKVIQPTAGLEHWYWYLTGKQRGNKGRRGNRAILKIASLVYKSPATPRQTISGIYGSVTSRLWHRTEREYRPWVHRREQRVQALLHCAKCGQNVPSPHHPKTYHVGLLLNRPQRARSVNFATGSAFLKIREANFIIYKNTASGTGEFSARLQPWDKAKLTIEIEIGQSSATREYASVIFIMCKQN